MVLRQAIRKEHAHNHALFQADLLHIFFNQFSGFAPLQFHHQTPCDLMHHPCPLGQRPHHGRHIFVAFINNGGPFCVIGKPVRFICILECRVIPVIQGSFGCKFQQICPLDGTGKQIQPYLARFVEIFPCTLLILCTESIRGGIPPELFQLIIDDYS